MEVATMDLHSPKRTIIINAFNSKVLCPLPTNTIPIIPRDRLLSSEEMTPKKGRKRALNHLTYEEKLMRKKLKNREAAQTSRDRKKARLDELEKTVRLFQKSNNELAREVQSLRSEKELVQRLQCQVKDLEEENLKLREELRCARVQSTPESTGSAVSTSPLPQGRSSAPTLVLTSLLIPTMIFHLTIACLGSMISNLSKTSSRTSFPVSRMKKCKVVGYKECNKLLDEMVASASAFLEPCEPTLLSPCSSDVERAPSSTLLQDAWKMATDSTEPISKVPSAHSVSQITSAEPSPLTPVHTHSSSGDNSEQVFEEMISEEVVITSEDLFLTEAWCGSSAGSEYDSDDCQSDQGYESTDLSDSMACERQTLSELFPNLM